MWNKTANVSEAVGWTLNLKFCSFNTTSLLSFSQLKILGFLSQTGSVVMCWKSWKTLFVRGRWGRRRQWWSLPKIRCLKSPASLAFKYILMKSCRGSVTSRSEKSGSFFIHLSSGKYFRRWWNIDAWQSGRWLHFCLCLDYYFISIRWDTEDKLCSWRAETGWTCLTGPFYLLWCRRVSGLLARGADEEGGDDARTDCFGRHRQGWETPGFQPATRRHRCQVTIIFLWFFQIQFQWEKEESAWVDWRLTKCWIN